jgi:phage repressor protein C with HTH and peptisase S24 domain
LSTFYIRVTSDSIAPRNHAGEFLIVVRMVKTHDGDIVVVAHVGTELRVKKLRIGRDGCI